MDWNGLELPDKKRRRGKMEVIKFPSTATSYPWRKVVGYERYSPTNNPHPSYPCTVMLQLECGHEVHRKASQVHSMPKKVRCSECAWKPIVKLDVASQ